MSPRRKTPPCPISVNGHITFTNQSSWSAFWRGSGDAARERCAFAFTGTTAICTPNNGFTGTRQLHLSRQTHRAGCIGDAIQITITVQPGAPVITSSLSANGTFNYAVRLSNCRKVDRPTSLARQVAEWVQRQRCGLISGTPDTRHVYSGRIRDQCGWNGECGTAGSRWAHGCQSIRLPHRRLPRATMCQSSSSPSIRWPRRRAGSR